MVSQGCPQNTLCGISSRFQLLSPSERQVAHALLTRPPLSQSRLRRISVCSASFDLHVLGTPPAFILSQDQTLNKLYLNRCLHRIKSILDRFLSSQKKLFLMSVFTDFKNPFLVLICISCSYIVQFSRYIFPPPFEGRRLDYCNTAFCACQELF